MAEAAPLPRSPPSPAQAAEPETPPRGRGVRSQGKAGLFEGRLNALPRRNRHRRAHQQSRNSRIWCSWRMLRHSGAGLRRETGTQWRGIAEGDRDALLHAICAVEGIDINDAKTGMKDIFEGTLGSLRASRSCRFHLRSRIGPAHERSGQCSRRRVARVCWRLDCLQTADGELSRRFVYRKRCEAGSGVCAT